MSERAVRDGRKRMGRPPGPRHRLRSHRVVTFVTESEFQRLHDLADENGRSISATLHELLAASLRQSDRHPIIKEP